MPTKKQDSSQIALIKRLAERSAANKKSGGSLGSSARIQLASNALALVGTCFGPNCERVLPPEKSLQAMIKEGQSQTIFTPESENVSLEKATSQSGFKVVAGELEVPENALLVMRHTLTSARKDRDGDILHPDGASLDPMAPLLWQHIWTMPVGKCLGIVEQTAETLKVVSAVIDMKNQLTEDIAMLVEANVLRFSHGFQAKRFTQMKNGGGLDITEYDIWEESLVSVPSNVDAVVEMYAKGKVKSPEVGLFAKGLSSVLRRNLGVGMDFEERAPSEPEAPEEPADKGEEETPEESPGEDCGCGGKGVKEGDKSPTLELKQVTMTGTKGAGYGMFEGSYEWILRCLERTAKSWLTGGGVNCSDRFVWNVATFPDYAIFCAESYNRGVANEHLFYRGKYEIADGVVRFTEVPEAVRLEVNVVAIGQRIDAMQSEVDSLETNPQGTGVMAEASGPASELAEKLADAKLKAGIETPSEKQPEGQPEQGQVAPGQFDMESNMDSVEASLISLDTENLKRLKRVVDAVNMLRHRESLRSDAKAVLSASQKR